MSSLQDTATYSGGQAPVPSSRPADYSSLVEVDFGAATDPGRRPSNEDHYKISRTLRSMETVKTSLPPGRIPDYFEQAGYSMAVADGMGGESAGEIASMMALTVGTHLRMKAVKWSLVIDESEARELMERAGRLIRAIDEAVTERARAEPELRGMGTTLTVSYSVGDDLFVFHVGDSRAYLFREGRLKQLTHDHTLAEALVKAGRLAPEDVAAHRLRHVLTNAIGSRTGQVEVEMLQLTLRDRDRVLLCSDGLTEMVPEEEIAQTLGQVESSQEACDQLIRMALDRGGKDNATVLVARYTLPVMVPESPS